MKCNKCKNKRKIRAKGLCASCYTMHLREKNGESAKSKAYKKWYQKQNKDYFSKKNREYKLQKNFGISIEEYNIILAQQKGVCAICEKPCKSSRALAVDHDHITGKVRGLLCVNCNNGLGRFNDDKKLLEKSIKYLSMV